MTVLAYRRVGDGLGRRLIASIVVGLLGWLAARSLSAQTDAGPGAASNAPSAVLDTWGTDAPAASASPEVPPSAAPAQVQAKAAERIPPRMALRAAAVGDLPDAAASAHVRYTLERIELRGNNRTRSRVILRYLKYKPGDIIDVDDPELTLTRYRMLGTGFFRDVQFALRKGSRRGQVVLLVDVIERNTIILTDIGMGLSSDANTNGKPRPLTAYGGFDVAETNLAGTGITLGAALAIAQNQSALRMRFLEPAFMGTPWMISGTLLRNKATDFFGTTDVQWCPPDLQTPCTNHYAIVDYSRFGGSLGIGRDVSTSTQLWVYYRLETIEAHKPPLAGEDRGGEIVPIEFDIRSGRSVLSTVRATFQLDTRDHPFLPTSGWYVSTWGELALLPFGSDYDYQRFDVSASRWWKVPGVPHVLRLQLFAGAETGTVPFFEQYYISDFSDFRAPRMLGLNFERRPPPHFLGGLIQEERYGQYAAKFALEYRIPLYRGSRSVYGIDLFTSAGIWALAARRDLLRPPPAYTGLSRVPVDLTANVGFRMDTSAGGLTFAFSNILGFVPLRGGGS
jgi:outer membrane protein insertion porin family